MIDKSTENPSREELQCKQQGTIKSLEGLLKNRFNHDVKVYGIEENAQLYSKTQWKEVLEGQFKIQGTELEQASELMMEFSKGVNDTYLYHANEKGIQSKVPQIYFYEGDEGTFIATQRDCSILINISTLKQFAKSSPYHKKPALHSVSKQVIIQGTNVQDFYLAGVEECDHTVFFTEHPSYQQTLLSIEGEEQKSLADYDAVEVEFRWLETGRIIAERKEWSDIAETLRQRHENAKKVKLGKQYVGKPFMGYNYPQVADMMDLVATDNQDFSSITWNNLSGERFSLDAHGRLSINQTDGRGGSTEREPSREDFDDFRLAVEYSLSRVENGRMLSFFVTHFNTALRDYY